MLDSLTEEDIELIFNSGDIELQNLIYQATTCGYYSFEPRPDCPDEFDEQSSFVNDFESKFSIALGGTGSGKTFGAAMKTARYVLETPPPRERCPFWIIGDTYDTTCDVCWNEKLFNIIPPNAIHGYDWYKSKRNWPYAVFLKHPKYPNDPTKIGWTLEFKSYEQGLSAMKAKSIGGYWFNEEVPYPIVLEVQGRCRDYGSPGWADFTPIEVSSPEWPELYDKPPDGWRFYHLNTEKNTALEPGWAQWYLSQIPEDMRETRRTGVFSHLSGQVFKEWRPAVNIAEKLVGSDWHRLRGLDFGFGNPFCCLWIARDRDGRYLVYDEHYSSRQLNSWHIQKIKERDWRDHNPYYGKTFSDHDAQQRAEMSAGGVHCTPANKTIKAGIETLRRLMMAGEDGKPSLYVHPRCKNLIREIRGYKWDENSDLPIDDDNHAIDAMRYAIYSDWLERNNKGRPEAKNYQREANRHGIILGNRDRSRNLIHAIRAQLGIGDGNR